MQLEPIIRAIDGLNERIGSAVSWLVLVLVFTTFLVAVLRYGFSLGWVWLQESYVWAHAIIFMAASGYALLHDGHVRIDIFYGIVRLRTRAWINLLGAIFLLLPTLCVIWWASYSYVALSWRRLESSGQAGGLEGLFLLKTCILVFVVLLGLQGLSLALRAILVLTGRSDKEFDEPFDGKA